eukprot:8854613-Pyramimonas_sp.AAC.1
MDSNLPISLPEGTRPLVNSELWQPPHRERGAAEVGKPLRGLGPRGLAGLSSQALPPNQQHRA